MKYLIYTLSIVSLSLISFPYAAENAAVFSRLTAVKYFTSRISNPPCSKEYFNTTEVYKLIEGDWKLISSHWSLTKPI